MDEKKWAEAVLEYILESNDIFCCECDIKLKKKISDISLKFVHVEWAKEQEKYYQCKKVKE